MDQESLSKEFYELSKIKYLIKKELENLNKNILNFDFKKKLLIEKKVEINDLKEFKDDESVQVFKTTPINGIEKTIGIIRNDNIKIGETINGISNELNKNIDYIAIDIQKRYVMKNENYFKLHFNPIYLELIKDPNEKINEIKNRNDVFDFKIKHNEINYKVFNINTSRKQNLSINLRDEVKKITDEINYYSEFEKNIILNKYIKSIDNRLNELESLLLNNNDFKDNKYLDISVTEKIESVSISTFETSENLINKVLNGHAMIKHALENNLPILDDMYEEKISFKILEIGSKDEILNKINFVIDTINFNSKENNKILEEVLEREISDKFTDPFEGLL